MECEEFKDRFTEYLEDEAEDSLDFEEHMKSCPECGEEYSFLTSFDSAMREKVEGEPKFYTKQAAYMDELIKKGVKGEAFRDAVREKFGSDDEKVEALVKKAEAYEKELKFAASIKALEDALEIRPDDAGILRYLGSIYLRNNQFIQAEKVLEKANELKPDDPDILNNLGSAYFKNNKLSESEKVLVIANELRQNDYIILGNLGNVYLRNNKLPEAEIILEKVNELRPDDPDILYYLGFVYLKKGKFPEAENVLERANELKPGNPLILNDLGSSYLEDNKLSEAEEVFKSAHELSLREPYILNNHAVLLMKKSEYEKALIILEKVISTDPYRISANNNIACAYYLIDDIHQAQHFIQIAHKLDSEHPIIQNNFDVIMGGSQNELKLLSMYSPLTIH